MTVISTGAGRAAGVVPFSDVLDGQGVCFWDWFEVLPSGCAHVEEHLVASTTRVKASGGDLLPCHPGERQSRDRMSVYMK